LEVKPHNLRKLKSTKILIFPFEIEFISLPINISTEQQYLLQLIWFIFFPRQTMPSFSRKGKEKSVTPWFRLVLVDKIKIKNGDQDELQDENKSFRASRHEKIRRCNL
jgi:hypothetical protein